MMLNLLSRVFQVAVTPVLWLSLTAAFVAVIVMIFRRILRSRIPHQALCVLWLIVFARLLLPVSIETPFSLVPSNITNQIYQTEQESEAEPQLSAAIPESPEPVEPNHTQPVPDPAVSDPVSQPQIPATSNPISSLPAASSPVVSQPENPVVSDPVVLEPQPTVPPVIEDEPALSEKEVRTRSGQAIAASVWLLGVAAMLVSGIVSYGKLRRQVYDAIRAEDGVWEHPLLRSPFILGLFRPKIYLPMGIAGPARQFILHHERAHLRRWDHVVKPICWLALTIHWFNPFAWGAFLLMSRDIEAACDESVIRKLGSEIKADYSATLLALATDKRFPAPSPLSFGEGDAEERIKNVLKFKKPVLWVSIGAAVVAAIAAVCLLTNQSPRSLDSFYPLAEWETAETVTAYFPKNEFPEDPEKVELSAEAAAEMTKAFHKYRYWRELSHLIPDNRIGWYDSLWKVCYQFENGSKITLNYSASGTLVVYHHSGLLPDGSAVNRRDRHYTVDGAEQFTAEILGIIMREFELASVEPDLSAYATMEDYPGLYFLEEPSSTVGTKVTAYKLIDGELMLVGGYEEHLANNFTVLIGPDGVEQPIFKSPDEVYAMFEEMLNEACGKITPSGPDLSEYTTEPDYPGLYFKKETNFQGGEKVTAYELVSNQLILVARYQEYPEYSYCGIAGPDGREQHVYAGASKAYDMFEDYLEEALDLSPQMHPFVLPDNAVLLGSLPEHELYLYQPKGSIRPVLYYQGREMQLTDVVMDTWLPLEFYPGDRDQDGITEIMIWFNQGHGTGFYEDGLLVCRLSEGELVVDIHDWSDLAEQFNSANSFSYDPQTHKLSVTYMGMTAQAEVPEYLYDLNWDSYGTAAVVNGDQVWYKVTGFDRATLTFMPALSNGDPVATYVGIELQCMLRYTGSKWAIEKELHLKDAALAGMPMELVTPATIPSNPEEYYLVAEVPEQNIRLYARNSGSEVLLVKDDLWKTYERRTHIEELVLPQVWYKSGSQWVTDTLYAISQIRNDGAFYVEELASYQFYNGDLSKWADDVYDWGFKAEDFNRNNTVVYDAETNTFAMTYKGRTYYTQPVGDFPASVNLPDGFTGVALITGHHVDYELKYTEYGTPSVSVTVKAALGFNSEGSFDENRIWQSADGYYEQSVGQIGITIIFYPGMQLGGFYYSDIHLKAGYEFPGLATTDRSETLWQDVIQNRIDAGFGDFYVIREDGTLVMWGEPDGAIEGSFLDDGYTVDDPLVLMENVVYVDANGEGSVFAIDENGTLWGMGGEADHDAPNIPLRIAENVAKVECGQYGDMFLMRDGTLWEGSGMLPALAKKEISGVTYNKVADDIVDVSYEGFGTGSAVTADGELWVWTYPDVPPQKLADDAARVFGYRMFVTTDGKLKFWSYNYEEGTYSVSEALLSDVEYAVGSFFGASYAVRADGTLWEIGSSGVKNIMDDVTSVASGEQETVVMKSDGSLWSISEDGDITQIASGRR